MRDADIDDDAFYASIAMDTGGREPLPGDQGSTGWLMERIGYATCSRFCDVLDFTKTGKEGAKRAKYRKELVIGRVTGKLVEHYVSRPMLDGIEREPLAKMAYSARTGRLTHDHGFQRHPSIEWVGGSPDAILSGPGGIECKCPTAPTHLDTLFNGMDNEHQPQVQGLMWVFGAPHWDFVSYHPDFEEPLRTYVERISRDEAYIAMLEEQVKRFLAEVAEQVERLRKMAGRA